MTSPDRRGTDPQGLGGGGHRRVSARAILSATNRYRTSEQSGKPGAWSEPSDMSEDTLYACRECLALGIETTEFQEVYKTPVVYGGTVIKVDGEPVFENDDLGGEVDYDGGELDYYTCMEWRHGHSSPNLTDLVVEVRYTDDSNSKLERVPKELGLV